MPLVETLSIGIVGIDGQAAAPRRRPGSEALMAKAKRAWGDAIQNRDEQFEMKRQVVLRTAARTYSKRGFYETTLTDIADELNISKPTLYYYFKSKDEILFECHRIGIEAITDGETP